MGAEYSRARHHATYSWASYRGTNPEHGDEDVPDEVLYHLFGFSLLLQVIYDLPWTHDRLSAVFWDLKRLLDTLVEMFGQTDLTFLERLPAVDLPFLMGFAVGSLFSWELNHGDLPSPLQNYLPKPAHAWKKFLATNLGVSETELSSLVGRCVGARMDVEVRADFIYLVCAVSDKLNGKTPRHAEAPAHHSGQRYVPCAVAAAWVDSKCKEDGLAGNLIPRFYLLQVLCDKLPMSTPAQHRISREISGIFALILDAASSYKVMYVSEVIDKFLVPYLQSQSELAKSLREYLPKRHQSWKYFLDHMEFNDEEKVFFALNCDSVHHDSGLLLWACRGLIGRFNSKYLGKVVWKIRRFDPGVFQVPKGHAEVDVFYATDRHITEDGEYIGQHRTMSASGDRKELHYGIMTVGIPDNGAPTRMETSEEVYPLKHVEILSIDTTLQEDRQGFVKKMNDKLVQEASAGEVLLYIHGYNVNHKDAIKQAAQLKHYLKFEGLVIVYSWPSNGTLWGYKHDEKAIEESAPGLHQIITTLLTEVEVKKVHILAHDMGNRALIEALQNFQKSDSSSLVKPSHSSNMQNIVQVDVKGVLENVIFLAPDAMRAKFEDMDLDNMCNMCNSRRMQELPLFFTIYSSDHLSWRLHEEKHLVNIQSLRQMNIREEDATPKRLIKVTEKFGVDLDMSHQHSYMDLDHKFLHDDIVGEIQNLLSSKQQAAVGIRINIIDN